MTAARPYMPAVMPPAFLMTDPQASFYLAASEGGSSLALSGNPFVGETLTMVGGAGAYQWTRNGSPISGATSAAYVVRLLDYGTTIGCTRGGSPAANTIRIWTPADIPQVKAVFDPDTNAFHTISPDVLALDGETCRRWNDITNTIPADQATAANQPLVQRAETASGGAAIQFDGANDLLTLSGSALDYFRNSQFSGLAMVVKDTGPTNTNVRVLASWSINASSSGRFALVSNTSEGAKWGLTVRPADGAGENNFFTRADANFHVVRADSNWRYGDTRLSIDGVEVQSFNSTPVTATPNTASLSAGVGGNPSGALWLAGEIGPFALYDGSTEIRPRDRFYLDLWLSRKAGLGGTYKTFFAAPVVMWGDSMTQANFGGWNNVGLTTRVTPPGVILESISTLEIFRQGKSGETTAQICARLKGSTDYQAYTTIIWAGANDITAPDPSAIVDLIQDAVTFLGHSNYLVVTPLMRGSWTSGEKAVVTAIRDGIISRFPAAHVLDNWTEVGHVTGGTVDAGYSRYTDLAVEDAFHPNTAWYAIWAPVAKAKLQALGLA